mgnify:CR=1 FL=1
MKKHFFFFLFLISSFLAAAQTYNYIGVEDGLSNRRVYAIQKGPKGYMWFLTNEGIDRYNGKDIKHYKLIEEDKKADAEKVITEDTLNGDPDAVVEDDQVDDGGELSDPDVIVMILQEKKVTMMMILWNLILTKMILKKSLIYQMVN